MKRSVFLSAAAVLMVATSVLLQHPVRAEARSIASPDDARQVARFLSLAEKCLDGDFELTYAVSGVNDDFFRGGSGTLRIAQLAGSGQSAWRTGPGSWSFRLEDHDGANAQWIEAGSSAEDCWKDASTAALRCTGPTEYGSSNGFMLSTLPFVEGTAVDELRFIIDPPDTPTGTPSSTTPELTLSTRPGSHLTGPLTCLSVKQPQGTTTCITPRGVIASVTNFDYMTVQWRNVQLIAQASTPKAADFKPEGKLTQPFAVPPV